MSYINQNRELCTEQDFPKWHIPAECSLQEKEGFAIVFDMPSGQFRHQASDRKSWNEYLLSIGMLKLSETQKIGASGEIENKTDEELFAEGKISLSDLKKSITEKVNQICSEKITGGFSSSALGQPYRYDSDDYDQWNMIGAAAMQSPVPYKCRNADGIEAFLVHSPVQMLQVLKDGAQIKLLLMMNAKSLKDRIASAQNYAALQSIDISSGWI